MNLGFQRRTATRISALCLALVLATAVVVDRQLGAGAATLPDHQLLARLMAFAPEPQLRAIILGMLLGVVAAGIAFAYAWWLLRPLDELSRAIDSHLRDPVNADSDQAPDQFLAELGALGHGVSTMMRRLHEHGKVQEESELRARAITRAVLDNSADGVITFDERSIVRSFNGAAEGMFGYHAAEVIGQKFTMLITAPHAEEQQAQLQEYIRTGKRKLIGREREVGGLRKDWTTFPMVLTFSELQLNGSRIFTAIVRDITERKRSQEALATSEARMRAILDTAADGIITMDDWGTIDSFNAAAEAIFGYGADDILGQNFMMLVARPQAESSEQPSNGKVTYSDVDIRGLIDQTQEVKGLRADGTTFPMELALSDVKLGDETLCTAIVRDATEQWEAQAALARRAEELTSRNEELAQFAYIASHDLQEPLRMVASYTQLLQRRYKGRLDADADEFISFAVDGANRMQSLLRGLLAYSRIGTQGQAFQKSDCEMVFDRAVANLRARIEECGATITHDPLPTIIADPSQLDQLFQNLVSNAIKFRCARAPHVHVAASRENDGWHFSVRDNGIGVDPQYHERIFVIFQRLHTKDQYPGTGIGLAICKKIVERHGGRIWIESDAGQGSVFHFALPDQPQAIAREPEPKTTTAEAELPNGRDKYLPTPVAYEAHPAQSQEKLHGRATD